MLSSSILYRNLAFPYYGRLKVQPGPLLSKSRLRESEFKLNNMLFNLSVVHLARLVNEMKEDSIAISAFVVILVEFDKYRI